MYSKIRDKNVQYVLIMSHAYLGPMSLDSLPNVCTTEPAVIDTNLWTPKENYSDAKGLKIKLIPLEKVQNEKVRKIMRKEADTLAEQFIVSGYSLRGDSNRITSLSQS
ncbi:MAG: hypothetical protein N2657_05740 [bacterium]|nr:hypothetical protein [bacterium]